MSNIDEQIRDALTKEDQKADQRNQQSCWPIRVSWPYL